MINFDIRHCLCCRGAAHTLPLHATSFSSQRSWAGAAAMHHGNSSTTINPIRQILQELGIQACSASLSWNKNEMEEMSKICNTANTIQHTAWKYENHKIRTVLAKSWTPLSWMASALGKKRNDNQWISMKCHHMQSWLAMTVCIAAVAGCKTQDAEQRKERPFK